MIASSCSPFLGSFSLLYPLHWHPKSPCLANKGPHRAPPHPQPASCMSSSPAAYHPPLTPLLIIVVPSPHRICCCYAAFRCSASSSELRAPPSALYRYPVPRHAGAQAIITPRLADFLRPTDPPPVPCCLLNPCVWASPSVVDILHSLAACSVLHHHLLSSMHRRLRTNSSRWSVLSLLTRCNCLHEVNVHCCSLASIKGRRKAISQSKPNLHL